MQSVTGFEPDEKRVFSEAVLRRIASAQAVCTTDPHHPPGCFLSSSSARLRSSGRGTYVSQMSTAPPASAVLRSSRTTSCSGLTSCVLPMWNKRSWGGSRPCSYAGFAVSLRSCLSSRRVGIESTRKASTPLRWRRRGRGQRRNEAGSAGPQEQRKQAQSCEKSFFVFVITRRVAAALVPPPGVACYALGDPKADDGLELLQHRRVAPVEVRHFRQVLVEVPRDREGVGRMKWVKVQEQGGRWHQQACGIASRRPRRHNPRAPLLGGGLEGPSGATEEGQPVVWRDGPRGRAVGAVGPDVPVALFSRLVRFAALEPRVLCRKKMFGRRVQNTSSSLPVPSLRDSKDSRRQKHRHKSLNRRRSARLISPLYQRRHTPFINNSKRSNDRSNERWIRAHGPTCGLAPGPSRPGSPSCGAPG